MNATIENFIGIYENAVSDEYCDRLITYFNLMEQAGFCKTRQQDEPTMARTFKEDTSMFVQAVSNFNVNSAELVAEFSEVLWGVCYKQYLDKFGVLATAGEHHCTVFKLQKTNISEGYHVWHFESSVESTANRMLVWTLYLNDVEEGGETEFLYYPKRIKPKKGTVLIWPAAFTHTHRGNPPLSGTKYIATGMIEL